MYSNEEVESRNTFAQGLISAAHDQIDINVLGLMQKYNLVDFKKNAFYFCSALSDPFGNLHRNIWLRAYFMA